MEKYEIITNIGRGSSGEVFLARNTSIKKAVAIKKIAIDESRKSRSKKSVTREANIMLLLDHFHIVKCYEWFLDKNTLTVSMVLEFCNGGTLQERIVSTTKKGESFSNMLVGKWTAQITSAVSYIHQQHILHRDLKSENVFLLKDDTIKLGDFGISKDLNHTLDQASTCVGTPCYLSPELCRDIPYSFKSDVWALGCLVYEVVMLKPAFDAANLISLFHKIVNCKFQPISPNCPRPLRDFISSILVADSTSRPSASQLMKSEYLSPYHDCVEQAEESAAETPTSMTSQSFFEDDWSKLDDMLRTRTDEDENREDFFATCETILAPKDEEEETSSESSCCSSIIKNNFKSQLNDVESTSESESFTENTASLSNTLNSSKGLDDEIPEVIESFEETNRSNTAVNSSKLPGSVWLHSKRAQALRQKSLVSGSTKLVTGVQRQKINGNSDVAQSLLIAPSVKEAKSFEILKTNVTNDDMRTNLKKIPSTRKITRRLVTRDKNEPITDTEKVVRNLPGSAWLYGGVKNRKNKASGDHQNNGCHGNNEVLRDGFNADGDSYHDYAYDEDDFEDDIDDDPVNSPSKTASSIEVIKKNCIETIGEQKYNDLCNMIESGLKIEEVQQKSPKIDHEILETCFLIIK